MSELSIPMALVLAAGVSAAAAAAGAAGGGEGGALRVPACTAYLEPDAGGARVSARSGITRWTDRKVKVVWFGRVKTPGTLRCAVSMRLGQGRSSRLRLTVAGQSREAAVTGADKPVTASFGTFNIRQAGYVRFALESLNPPNTPPGDVDALVLDGPAAREAHFNLKPRRNAASVHLMYPFPKGAKVSAFYCEVTAVEDPVWTFYMACGWHRGYLGMQVNSVKERRFIFSVWDSSSEPRDRRKVGEADRVKLLAKGEGVHTNAFGGEGTGGHSHLVCPWKTGRTQRFLVTAEPVDATHTVYSGFYYAAAKNKWLLLSRWRAPKDGGYLRGLHSFSENFVGRNGHLRRKALYGNQWFRDEKGRWTELTTAKFSHDGTGRADRLDRFMGVENGRFFLSHGGFVEGMTPYGKPFTRPPTGQAPSDVVLPRPPD